MNQYNIHYCLIGILALNNMLYADALWDCSIEMPDNIIIHTKIIEGYRGSGEANESNNWTIPEDNKWTVFEVLVENDSNNKFTDLNGYWKLPGKAISHDQDEDHWEKLHKVNKTVIQKTHWTPLK